MGLFPDSVSGVYGCSFVFWEKFLFVAYFVIGYVVLVRSKGSIY